MSHKVCILGAGSVAAFIYAACKSYDINPDIYTKGTVRIPNGAFWYHWVPNYVDLEPETIRIYSVGDELGYVRKQWGDTVKVNPNSSSFPRSPKIVKGWNPSQAYPMIMRECNIIYTGMDQDDEYSRLKSEEYDLVFQTYPTRHHYEAKQEFIVTVPTTSYKIEGNSYNTVCYNGDFSEELVRMSILFGYVHYEWVRYKVIKVNSFVKVSSNPDLEPNTVPVFESGIAENVILMGRSACWNRHVLSSDTYDETRVILEGYYGSALGKSSETME